MAVSERIKQIRQQNNLTMDSFGRRIGVGKTAISHIESGKANPSDQTMRSICREFHVREEWLWTGDGDMYEPQSGDALDILTAEFGFSEKERHVAEIFITLDAARRKAALEYLSDVIDALNREELAPEPEMARAIDTDAADFPEDAPQGKRLSKDEIADRVEAYRRHLSGEREETEQERHERHKREARAEADEYYEEILREKTAADDTSAFDGYSGNGQLA